MGLLDEIKKKQEEKIQELNEQIPELDPPDLIQEILKLESEIDKLNSLNLKLDKENKNLLDKAKQVNEMEIEVEKLRTLGKENQNTIESGKQKEKQLDNNVSRLQQNLNDSQSKNRELINRLNEEKTALDRSVDNLNGSTQNLKMMFVGNVLLNVVLLFFLTMQNKAAFLECGEWFKDRTADLWEFFLWLKNGLYQGIYAFIEGELHTGEMLSNLLSIVVMLLIAGMLFMIGKKAKDEFDLRSEHANYYWTKGKPYVILMTVISVDIAIGLFIACLCLYSPIKTMLPSFNIFSIWLIFMAAGILIVNFKDWKAGFR